jgi:FAD/FMN-containing dehydrogenase
MDDSDVAASAMSLDAGPVLRPGEPRYAEWLARLPSGTSGSRRPSAVIMPGTASDVQKCMRWAARHDQKVTVVGGGHSDHCVWDGALAIDLRHSLSTVQLLAESNLLVAGGGASMAAIAKAAEAGGRMCCLGTAPSVGVGLLLQGGVGHLARWRGLAVDHIQRVECVTPDGRQRTLSCSDELELFWAFCGAGPNFGVVLNVVLRTFPLVPVLCAELHWSRGSGAESSQVKASSGDTRSLWTEERALLGYAAAASRCDATQTMDAMLHWVSEPRDWRLTVVVSTFEWEAEPPDVSECEAEPPESGAGRPIRAAHASPLLSTLRTAMVEALGTASKEDDAAMVEAAHARCKRPSELFAREHYLRVDPTIGVAPPATPSDSLRFWVRCAFLPIPLTAEAAAVLCAAVRDAPNRACYVNLQHTGGAAARPTSEHAIAFSHRGWEWSAVVTGVHRAADEQAVHAWVLATIERLLPLAVGTYTVDLGPTDGALAARAFDEASASQLCSLKRAYDPNQLLAHCLPLRETREEVA